MKSREVLKQRFL